MYVLLQVNSRTFLLKLMVLIPIVLIMAHPPNGESINGHFQTMGVVGATRYVYICDVYHYIIISDGVHYL